MESMLRRLTTPPILYALKNKMFRTNTQFRDSLKPSREKNHSNPVYRGIAASLLSLIGFCFVLGSHSVTVAQSDSNSALANSAIDDSEDDEPVQIPGLLGQYSSGDVTISRRESDLSFVWDKFSPIQALPEGPFRGTLKGKLLIKSPGKYRFHTQLQGQVQIQIAGQKGLAGSTEKIDWKSGEEISLEYGEQPFQVDFESAPQGAVLKLYWSSDSFRLEPIPSTALFLDQPVPELEQAEHGKLLFTAHRCNRCHVEANDPASPPGPDLTHVSSGLQAGWLNTWLTAASKTGQHASMPEFGLSTDDVAAVEAFLRQQSQSVSLEAQEPKSKQREEFTKSGQVLFLSLGCLACHGHSVEGAVGAESDAKTPIAVPTDAANPSGQTNVQHVQKGQVSPLGGSDLSRIGEKRTFAWLVQWLTDPSKLNADHRMPIFRLKRDAKNDEVLQLATFLSQQKREPLVAQKNHVAALDELVQRGKQLVTAARCAACHRIPGIQPNLQGVPKLDLQTNSSNLGCLQIKPDPSKWRPAYPTADRDAILAYLAVRTKVFAPESPFERGQRLLAWNNCLSCHPRHGGMGLGPNAALAGELLPELKGQGPTLVPPSLSAVGDKLRDDFLMQAVAGEIPAPRMPWLRIRMPRFKHSDADRKAITDYFVQHDRIENPPAEFVHQTPPVESSGQLAVMTAGHTLLGSQGFSCIACHRFGSFEPRNAALGTRGSDLRLIGQRMRREFFIRWTRSPIRIVANMEMPSFERPVEGILDGKIDTQLAALWESLQDPNASRPLEVSAVQQNLTVKANEHARIVRDVFSVLTDGQDKHIARSFAIGLANQNNILIDLDTFRLREWWLGDFARQRTEGKSWYWDLGGVRVATDFGKRPDLVLIRGIESESTLIEPLSRHGIVGELKAYHPSGLGVQFKYSLNFATSPTAMTIPLEVTETVVPVEPVEGGSGGGWRRSFVITGIPEGFRIGFIRPDAARADGRFEVIPNLASSKAWRTMHLASGQTNAAELDVSELAPQAGGAVGGEFQYHARSTPIVREAPQPIVQTSKMETIDTVPGYSATRLPLPRAIMPTAMTWTRQGVMAIASLKGHIYYVRDSDGDGIEDQLQLFEEGLAAPYGLIADDAGEGLIVSHKPELLRLLDTDGDGRADSRQVIATGWGYNDNYHDWTCGIVRDSSGRLYVGLGSDYTQPKRPREQQRWRGKILRIDRSGKIEPIASGLRYPTGLAMTSDDELFVTDNQGEQNTFNELNHIVAGERYGVPSMEDKAESNVATPRRPAIQIPHPWTRSINGIFFIPMDTKLASGQPHPFAGHGIGCEYDTRYLIRFSLQKVGNTFQGAVYPFSLDQVPPETPNFEGTLSGGINPQGDIFIGCIHDSGWLGGLNVGSIYRLRQTGTLPAGMREIRVVPEGFAITFTGPVSTTAAAELKNYAIAAYTREWGGGYSTPDSQRHQLVIKSVMVAQGGQQVILTTDKLREGFVYEISCGKIGLDPKTALWPATGHYTVNQIP